MRLCLYGASSNLIDKKYIEATEKLGEEMAKRGHTLVFGGGANGLMGAAARGATKAGGEILGISPKFFDVDGVLYDKCTEFIYTETMQERKHLLVTKSDGFIVMPGGPGTFDELFETLSLRQLGIHNKPIAVFNIDGYFDPLGQMLKNAYDGNFMTEEILQLCPLFNNETELLKYLEENEKGTGDFSVLKALK
ncbi:MAG: TIGR00730 family Rossman fold protein [Acutalibacteraceae bacterium]|nr:TIGR00730 family Rossman fold protein [Acutalibacteraceae bacterium]